VLIMEDNLWKNNINFVKDTPMKYINIYKNFNTTIIIVSDEKNKKHYFHTNLCNFHSYKGGKNSHN
jgi:hypothetical protein